MRGAMLVLLGILTPGCGGPGASSLEASCGTVEVGDPGASGAAVAGLERLNCYRNHVGLQPARLDARLSAAAQAHAEYLVAAGAQGHDESPGAPGFTGATPADRARAAGYPLDDFVTSLSEVVGFHEAGADSPGAVDYWMSTVYHRTPLTTPGVTGVGVGQAGVYDVMLLAAPWEGGRGVGRYPADGQVDVPTSFDTDRETPDPDPLRGVVGHPLSLTFLRPGFVDSDDLYGITVERSTLAGGSEPVDTTLLTPADDPLLRRSVVLIPQTPLRPRTTYTVAIHGTVGGEAFVEEWSFVTGEP